MNRFLLAHFGDDDPCYTLVEDGALRRIEEKEAYRNLPVLALVPDSYLYFFQLHAPPRTSRRYQLKSLHMQMQTALPTVLPGGHAHIVIPPSRQPLAMYTQPDLNQFWERHGDVLDKATWVASEFYLAFCAATLQEEDSWIWCSSSGMAASFENRELRYTLGDRLFENPHTRAPQTVVYDLERSLEALDKTKGTVSQLALPLHNLLGRERLSLRAFAVLLALVTLAGALFVGGETIRWRVAADQAATMSQELDNEYLGVLSPPLGRDPYGRLLFALDQAQGGQAGGVDTMDVLELLSRVAPQGFRVRSLSMNAESGSIRATVENLEVMDTMLSKLNESERYTITLDQAWNTAEGVVLSLGVEKAR